MLFPEILNVSRGGAEELFHLRCTTDNRNELPYSLDTKMQLIIFLPVNSRFWFATKTSTTAKRHENSNNNKKHLKKIAESNMKLPILGKT